MKNFKLKKSTEIKYQPFKIEQQQSIQINPKISNSKSDLFNLHEAKTNLTIIRTLIV